MLTQVSLFTGIGGIDLGFDLAGFESVLQCEIDKSATTVLERWWPEVERIEDVQHLSREPVGVGSGTRNGSGPAKGSVAQLSGHPTVVHFGSPCQDLSVAGKRAGLAGERSGLFFEAIRVIRELRPEFAVWENVGGSLSSNNGRDFGAVLDALAEAGAVDIAWRVLDVQWFGVAQERHRVFVVADFRGERAGEILLEPEGVPRNPPTRRPPGEEVAASVGGGATGAGRTTEEIGEQVVVAPLRTSPYDHSDPLYQARMLTMGVAKPLGAHHHRQDLDNETYVPEIAHSMSVRDHKGVASSGDQVTMLATPCVRRLTPRECERVMGFGDDWTRYAADGSEISDSARYRMLGNACPPMFANMIAWRMRYAIERDKMA